VELVKPALVALVITGALLVAGGIAYATIPDSSGVIHGCYGKAWPDRGVLRVIDADKSQTCSKFETPLNWSQTGPQGPQGPQGPNGPTGATGPSDVWSVDGYGSGQKSVGKALSIATLATTATLPAGSYSVQAETSLENNTVSLQYTATGAISEAFNWQLSAIEIGTVHS
jgi:hypothetical protein